MLYMPDSFKSLGEIFRSEPKLNNIRRIVKSSEVILDFYKIFPDLEKIVKPKKVEKMFLKIRVENAVWRSELKFKELEIVEKINNYYNEERIKGIKFTN